MSTNKTIKKIAKTTANVVSGAGFGLTCAVAGTVKSTVEAAATVITLPFAAIGGAANALETGSPRWDKQASNLHKERKE